MATGSDTPATMTTQAAGSVTAVSAVLNGTIVNSGIYISAGTPRGASINEAGFVISKKPNPTVADTKIVTSTTGVQIGSYSKQITGLVPNTVYHYRSYAINSSTAGPGYGDDVTFVFYTPKDWFRKTYQYKVYSNAGQYLGNLPEPSNEFILTKEMNTAGSQISVVVPVSADTSAQQSVTTIDDEQAGANILDETGSPILSEGAPPLVGLGTVTGTLIRNGNTLVVIEYGYYSPNGRVRFRGQIQKWEATYGGDTGGDDITLTVYSDGQDLDQYLIKGSPYTYAQDQAQTSQTGRFSLYWSTGDQGGGWNFYGQSFTVGTGFTNVGAVSLMLAGTANVTVTLYDGPAMANIVAVVTQLVSVPDLTEVQFGFPSHAIVTPGTTLFFTAKVNQGESIWIYYQNSNNYANGSMYTSVYAGGSGGGGWNPDTTKELYFKTFSSSGSTTATFTNQNIVTGMLKPIMNDYLASGGLVKYTADSIGTTSTVLSYTFNTNTVYEGINAIQSIAPGGFYWYVNVATSILNFKQVGTVPDVVLTKGRHLNSIKIGATIEYLVNTSAVTGRAPDGTNIYTIDQDSASIAQYGIRLDRKNDTRALNVAAAHAIGTSDVADGKDEKYVTEITVVDKTMDIAVFEPGMLIGFAGFGTFVDGLTSQIVRLEEHPDYIKLSLGRIPRRSDVTLDEITRGLTASLTVDNPNSPS